ncbi:MAG TPA: high-potential iron-sulfur protein [Burkholderiales bacterium]|nr:high-potential iron-sulfur protein [Burkholderiales bacterium]
MSAQPFRHGRRRILLLGSLALIPAVGLAQAPKRVSEGEPQAQGLGYKEDVAKVDQAKFKNYQPGQTCANCNFFKGKSADAWGPCDIFSAREVSAKGWCSAWAKKAA